jgi:predicted transcriptional regulator
MENKIYVAEGDEIADVARALDSELRRKILALLDGRRLNINQIADELGIPQSTCAVNVQTLERAKLIRTEQVAASKGSQKVCSLRFDEVVLPLRGGPALQDERMITIEMPIGLYTDFKASAPCGLLSDTAIIGYFDLADSFLSPKRASAGLIWFTRGYLEYRFPKEFTVEAGKIASLTVSAEVCSEFPGYNNNWPSEITVWINDVEIGTWVSPGDMGGEYGRLTPSWWDLKNTQFGFLKSWKVTREGSYIDGVRSGDAVVDDLAIAEMDFFKVRIGVKEDAEYQGGLNVFGRSFGNYEQEILFKIELENGA